MGVLSKAQRKKRDEVTHCYYCKIELKPSTVNKKESRTIDHILPRWSGGITEGNSVVCCYTCNMKKGGYLVPNLPLNWFLLTHDQLNHYINRHIVSNKKRKKKAEKWGNSLGICFPVDKIRLVPCRKYKDVGAYL